MNNNSLARYENNGIELIINTETGESFATAKGYAIMSGKLLSTINSRLPWTKGGRFTYVKAEMQTQSGVQTVPLIPESLIIEWLPEDNPTMVTQLMKLGVRGYLHKLAGYQVNSSAITTSHKIPSSYAEALLEAGRLALENEKLITEAKQETTDIMQIFDTEKKEYFTTTKIENKSCIVERLNNDFNKDVNITLINLTQVELLEIASNLSGLSKEEIVKQSVEYMAQKLITLYSKPQEYSEVELRIIETLKTLMYQLKQGVLTQITKTRIIQQSFCNPNTVNKFFEKLGILDLVNSKISLDDLFKIYEVLPEVKS